MKIKTINRCVKLPVTQSPRPNHPLFKDLTGQRFSRLIVKDYAGRIGTSHAFLCGCDCGAEITTRGYCLTMGETKSCGCIIADNNRARLTTHGLGGKPIWRIWAGMKTRCLNKNVKAYPLYGGMGVKVCARWLFGQDGKSGFECFYADMGPRPSAEYSIDRYPDPAGNYEPGNVRWATDNQQAQNTRKTKRIIFRGEEKTVHEWSAIVGIKAYEILRRLGRNWSIDRALTQPMRVRQ